jgi:hydrogenase nickel incorporation protein HypA/HybF
MDEMHEMSLMNDLMNKIESIAREHDAPRVVGVRVWLGALSHISPGHFKEHFVEGAKGTRAEGAVLDIETSDDATDEHAQEILLRSVDVGE